MNGQMGFGGMDARVADSLDDAVTATEANVSAHARRTDPGTSHEAARSLEPMRLNANRLAVLGVIARVGRPLADEQWMVAYGRDAPARGVEPAADDLPRQSPSGLRSRRNDLVEMGYVEAVGETKIRNRRCITWGITAAGVAALEEL